MSRAWLRTCSSNLKKGFLLIELLIGLTMLMMVIMGASGYFQQLVKAHREGKNRMVAITLARSAMAQLVAGKQHSIEKQWDQFTIDWRIIPDLKTKFSKAQVCVSWSVIPGVVRSITLDSGVCNADA